MKRIALTATLAVAALALTACAVPAGKVIAHHHTDAYYTTRLTCDAKAQCSTSPERVPDSYTLTIRDDKTEEKITVEVGSIAYDHCTDGKHGNHYPGCAS